MKLRDAVTFTPTPDGNLLEDEFQSRACSVELDIKDACDADAEATGGVLVQGTGLGVYPARPFVVRAEVAPSVRCSIPGGAAWLTSVTEEALSFAVARALTVTPNPGYGADQVWIGADGVTAVPAAGDVRTTPGAEALALAIAVARARWFRLVAREPGVAPILHLSPLAVPALARLVMLRLSGDDYVTVWGDPVVMDEGYDPIDLDAGAPVAFWTPPFEVEHGPAQDIGDDVVQTSVNTQRLLTTIPVRVSLAACSIVRVDLTAA
jgi:hypothetical protein